MTFNEFINECTYFEYSQEYFEINKTISELHLIEMYHDSLLFNKENDVFNENYFNDNITDHIMNTYMEASKNILGIIVTKARKAFRVVVNFFRKLLGLASANTKNADAIMKYFKKNKIDQKFVDKFKSQLSDMSKELNVVKLDESIRHIKPLFQYADDVNVGFDGVEDLMLRLLLTDNLTEIIVSVPILNERRMKLLKTIIDMIIKNDMINKSSTHEWSQYNDFIEKQFAEINNGDKIIIDFSRDKLEKYVTMIEDISKLFEDKVLNVVNSDDVKNTYTENYLSAMNKFMQYIQRIISTTMTFYNTIMKYRTNLLHDMSLYISNISTANTTSVRSNSNHDDALYYYHSYKRSPIGFQPMTIISESGKYKLKSGIPQQIEKIVTNGDYKVLTMFGNILNNDQYFIFFNFYEKTKQVHELKDQAKDTDPHWQLGKFGYSSSDINKIKSFLYKGPDRSTIAKIIAGSMYSDKEIIPDNVEFNRECGYGLDQNGIDKVCNTKFGSLINDIDIGNIDWNSTYVQFSKSSKDSISFVKQTLGAKSAKDCGHNWVKFEY